MAACFLLPGFAGTELIDTESGYTVWADTVWFAFKGLEALRLANDGVTPYVGEGLPLKTDLSVKDYMGPLSSVISKKTLYTPKLWGIDWRKDIPAEGRRLANYIMSGEYGAGPHVIVAHSAGGLVARFAYGYLKAEGLHGRIRRIITLGTPHRGCYAPVRVFRGQDPLVQQIQGMTKYQPDVFATDDASFVIPKKLLTIAYNWPGLYQLFPVLDALRAEEDPHAGMVFDRLNWFADLPISAAWLTQARDVFQPLLAAANNLPPFDVLTTVAGIFGPTPFKLTGNKFFGKYPAIAFGNLGDGTVYVDSACTAASRQYVCYSDHANLVNCPQILSKLPDWIAEVRTNDTPPPPRTQVSGAKPSPGNQGISPVKVLATTDTGSKSRSSTSQPTGDLNVSIPRPTVPIPATKVVLPKPGQAPPDGVIDIPDPPYRRPTNAGRRR